MPLAAFDGSCESLAVLSTDGRLKLWDAMTGKLRQQYVEPDHLVQRYTCLSWGPPSRQRGVASRAKKARLAQPGLIALGTDSGKTVVWDLARGEVVQRLGAGQGESADSGHTARVNDAVFSPDGAVIHTCGEDKRVLSWDVASGAAIGKPLKAGKSAPHRMAVSSDGNVLAVGGLQIKLWDTSSRKSARRLAGHALPVTCMCFSQDGALLISGCGDRYLSLWDTSPDSDSVTALSALSMEGAPVRMMMAQRDLLCLDDTGTAKVWRLTAPYTAAAKAPQCVVRVEQAAADSKIHDTVMAVALAPNGQLALSHGTELKPTLVVANYLDKTGQNIRSGVEVVAAGGLDSVLIEHDAMESSLEAKPSKRNGQLSVLGAADMPVPMKMSAARGAAAPTDEEISLGDQVEQMVLDQDADETSRRRSGSAPTSGSLASLLIQVTHGIRPYSSPLSPCKPCLILPVHTSRGSYWAHSRAHSGVAK